MAGPVSLLRGLEHAGDDGVAGAPGGRPDGGRAATDLQNGDGDHGGARRPHRDRHRRIRPRAGRWIGRRIGDSARRRSGDRQVHHPASGGRCTVARARGRICLGRGIGAPGRASRAAARARGDQPAAARGNARRGDTRRRRGHRGQGAHRRFDPDRADRGERIVDGVGIPGAGVRRASGASREGRRHRGVPDRTRYQGGSDRRSAHPRAHGRHGALFRKRPGQPLPRHPRGQEPLRRGERDRRVRDDRTGAQGGAQSVGDIPVAAGGAGAWQHRDGGARRQPAAAGRGAGAARRRAGCRAASCRRRARHEPPRAAARGAASPRRGRDRRSRRVRQRRGRRADRRAGGGSAGRARGRIEPARTTAARRPRRFRRARAHGRDPTRALRRGAAARGGQTGLCARDRAGRQRPTPRHRAVSR